LVISTITTKAVVDEFTVGGKESGKPGRSKGKKKLAIMAIEYNDFGILRCYAKVIENAGTKQLRPFIETHIAKEAEIRTDKWRGYRPLKKDYPKLNQIKSENAKYMTKIQKFL